MHERKKDIYKTLLSAKKYLQKQHYVQLMLYRMESCTSISEQIVQHGLRKDIVIFFENSKSGTLFTYLYHSFQRI